MDAQTRDNWRKVKEALEKAGKTDNHYYRRALVILAGRPDPFNRYNGFEPRRPDDGRP